jgi:hypothetical protein
MLFITFKKTLRTLVTYGTFVPFPDKVQIQDVLTDIWLYREN